MKLYSRTPTPTKYNSETLKPSNTTSPNNQYPLVSMEVLIISDSIVVKKSSKIGDVETKPMNQS